jgi:BCD family chlorophyll transporter-like MFS transporter
VASVLLNALALWKQEPRNRSRLHEPRAVESFRATWQRFADRGRVRRFLVAVGLGTAAFSMQDIILEPYGGEVLGLGVAATTQLTALMAGGGLVAFALAARWLSRGADPYRVAAAGVLVGLLGFSAVIFAEPLDAPTLFRGGAALIGLGGGLFSVGTLCAAMGLDARGQHGLAIGAWGAVQATCLGLATAAGGILRDGAAVLARDGWLGAALQHNPATGYGVVYHLELVLLFATLVALGPLVARTRRTAPPHSRTFGLAELPG